MLIQSTSYRKKRFILEISKKRKVISQIFYSTTHFKSIQFKTSKKDRIVVNELSEEKKDTKNNIWDNYFKKESDEESSD